VVLRVVRVFLKYGPGFSGTTLSVPLTSFVSVSTRVVQTRPLTKIDQSKSGPVFGGLCSVESTVLVSESFAALVRVSSRARQSHSQSLFLRYSMLLYLRLPLKFCDLLLAFRTNCADVFLPSRSGRRRCEMCFARLFNVLVQNRNSGFSIPAPSIRDSYLESSRDPPTVFELLLVSNHLPHHGRLTHHAII